MKYIKLFATINDARAWRDGSEHILPNVCLCIDPQNDFFMYNYRFVFAS